MKYTGLDEDLEKQHSLLGSGVITKTEFDTKLVAGNSILAKRLAINAKIHNGGIICLMGARRLPSIITELHKIFETLPLLKQHSEALSQFRNIRLIPYDLTTETSLINQLTLLGQEFDWFKLTKFDTPNADANFFAILVTTTDETKTNIRVNSMN